jgi:methionyl-tRNA formyltransferase
MEKNLRIVFMGTPTFAVKPLLALIKNGYNILGLVSQPDRPVGRNREILPTPTKKVALENNIKVLQPEKIKIDYQGLLDLKPDVIITCAYGQIIPQEVLKFPKYGCLNLHGSILPKYRGGAPIHHALINGETETGISVMQMANKMDAGDVYNIHYLKILDNDNYDSLASKMSELAAAAIIEDLPLIINHKLVAKKQNEAEVSFGYNIKPEQEKVNWNQAAQKVHNFIRGLSSNPGANSILNGQIIKLFTGEVTFEKSNKKPGTIVGFDHGILVATNDFNYRLLSLQLASKKRMDAKAVINGFKNLLINQAFDTN